MIRNIFTAVSVLLLAGASAARSPADDRYADNACVNCHRNLAGRLGEIVDVEWANSVHYANNVACEGCHGGDATARAEQFPSDKELKEAAHAGRNPEFSLLHGTGAGFVSRARGRSVSYFCGRCHTEIMEKHLGSPHGAFGDPSCLYCHGQGSHAIGEPSPSIIDTRSKSEGGRCALCHQSSTMQTVATIKTMLVEAAQSIDASAREYARLEELGYRNLSLGEAHHHTADTHSRLRRVFHSFNMREISELTRSIDAVGKRTAYAVQLVEALDRSRRQQTVVGIAAVVFLMVFAGVLVFYKRVFCEDYDRSRARPTAE
jgi:hypothetical protein